MAPSFFNHGRATTGLNLMATPQILIESPDIGTQYLPLEQRAIVIGRKDSDFNIAERYISSQHLSVQLVALVRDLGSRNGTWKKGERVQEVVLEEGESICLGQPDKSKTFLTLVFGQSAPEVDQYESDQATICQDTGPTLRKPKSEVFYRQDRSPQYPDRQDSDRQDSDRQYPGRRSPEVHSPEPERDSDDIPPTMAAPRTGEGTRDDALRELSTLRSKVQDLEAKLAFAKSESETTRNELEKKSRACADLQAETESLKRKLGEVGESHDALKSQVEAWEVQAKKAEKTGTPLVAPPRIRELISKFEESAHDPEDFRNIKIHQQDFEIMQNREGVWRDFGYSFGRILWFARRVEKVILEFANKILKVQPESEATMLPAADGQFQLTGVGLKKCTLDILRLGGVGTTSQLENYLKQLARWYIVHEVAYPAGFESWYQETLNSVSPENIRQRVKPTWFEKTFGRTPYKRYWKEFAEWAEKRPPLVARQEFEDFVEQAAKEHLRQNGAPD